MRRPPVSTDLIDRLSTTTPGQPSSQQEVLWELRRVILAGDASAYGHIVTYDGQKDALRSVPVRARTECALCGSKPAISTIEASRYSAPACGL